MTTKFKNFLENFKKNSNLANDTNFKNTKISLIILKRFIEENKIKSDTDLLNEVSSALPNVYTKLIKKFKKISFSNFVEEIEHGVGYIIDTIYNLAPQR